MLLSRASQPELEMPVSPFKNRERGFWSRGLINKAITAQEGKRRKRVDPLGKHANEVSGVSTHSLLYRVHLSLVPNPSPKNWSDPSLGVDELPENSRTRSLRVDELLANARTRSLRVDELLANSRTRSLRVDELLANSRTRSLGVGHFAAKGSHSGSKRTIFRAYKDFAALLFGTIHAMTAGRPLLIEPGKMTPFAPPPIVGKWQETMGCG